MVENWSKKLLSDSSVGVKETKYKDNSSYMCLPYNSLCKSICAISDSLHSILVCKWLLSVEREAKS